MRHHYPGHAPSFVQGRLYHYPGQAISLRRAGPIITRNPQDFFVDTLRKHASLRKAIPFAAETSLNTDRNEDFLDKNDRTRLLVVPFYTQHITKVGKRNSKSQGLERKLNPPAYTQLSPSG